jgi:RHS repeat-associated protein
LTQNASTGGFTLKTADQVAYAFDAAGLPTTVKDRNGQGLTYTTDGQRVTRIADGTRSLELRYEGSLLTQVLLSDGRTVDYGYTDGRLTSAKDASGRTSQYTYDSAGNLQTITSASGRQIVRNTYDGSGRVVSQEDAKGNVSTFEYQSDGDVVMTDARGGTWTDSYDNGYLVRRTDPTGGVWRYYRDDELRMVATVDPGGSATSFMYRGADLAGVRNAEGGVEAFRYNGRHDVVASSDALGNRTDYAYDTAGNLTSVTPASGHARRWSWAADGTLTSKTDEAGNVTRFTYGPHGELIRREQPGDLVETFAYDARGRLESTVSPRGNVTGAQPEDFRTTFDYDEFDNPVAVTNPLGHTTRTTYDPDGRPTSVTDARGNTTTYTYDSTGKLDSQVSGDGRRTFDYDANGNLSALTDERGNATGATAANFTTRMQYDQANRLTTVTNPAAGTTTFGYNSRGLRTSITAPSGKVSTLSYNKLGLLTRVDYSDGTPAVSYAYNTAGQRTRMNDALGYIAYTYDTSHRVTSATRTYATGTSPVATDRFDYTYDPRGLLASRTFPGQQTDHYTYDAAGRFSTLKRGSGTSAITVASATYDTLSGQVTLTRRGGVVETRSFDRLGRPSSIEINRSGQAVLTQTVQRDANGNVTGLQDSKSGPHTYTYDHANRLTGVCDAASCPTTNTIDYTYDSVGNRVRETRAGQATNWTYDAANLMRQRTGHLGAATFSYDADGNRTSDPQGTYTWNAAGRMTKSVISGATTTYHYDGDGRRAWTAIPGSKAGTLNKTWNIWDPQTYQLALERDNAGAVARRYSYSLGLDTMSVGTTDYVLATDIQGSVRSVLDTTGVEHIRSVFEPYGRTISSTSLTNKAPKVTLGYTGELLDATGLIHLRARQYDPVNGVFLSPDAGASGSNLGYAAGNPFTFHDPMGTDPDGIPWGTISVVTGSAAVGCATIAVALCGPAVPLLTVVSVGTGLADVLTGQDAQACYSGKGSCGSLIPAVMLNVLPGGSSAKLALKYGDEAVEVGAKVCSDNSFTAQTMVLMADGTRKAIKEVRLGDKVLAADPETGKQGPRKVIDLIRHSGLHTMVAVRLADGSIIDATDHHPFWVESRRQWVDAIELKRGDRLLTADGRRAKVLTAYVRTEDVAAYNLAVQGLHTYFAGDGGILVHNCDPSDLRGLSDSFVKRLLKQYGTDPHAFKEEFVGRANVSRFDIKSGPNGELHVVSKDGKVVIPTGVFRDE